MAFCGQCGSEVGKEQRFCSSCGHRVNAFAPSVADDLDGISIPLAEPVAGLSPKVKKAKSTKNGVLGVLTLLVIALITGLSLSESSQTGGMTKQQVLRLYHVKKGTGLEYFEDIGWKRANFEIVQIGSGYTPSATAAGLGSDSCTDDWYVTQGKWFILPYGRVQIPCSSVWS